MSTGLNGKRLVDALPLRSDRLRLRLFRPQDLEPQLALQSDPDVVRWLPYGVRSRDEVEDGLRKRLLPPVLDRDDQLLRLVIERAADGVFVGELTLILRSVAHLQGEIGYVIGPRFTGRGYATEATRTGLAAAFDLLGLHRVIGRCDVLNPASATVMRKAGMRLEAVHHHVEVFKGQWSDLMVFALLDDEPRDEPGRGTSAAADLGRSGSVVHAVDVARVAAFYRDVAGLLPVAHEPGFVVLQSATTQVVVVAVPPSRTGGRGADPSTDRAQATTRVGLSVADLAVARAVAAERGGVVEPPQSEWTSVGARLCEGHDPEGNPIQVRVRLVG